MLSYNFKGKVAIVTGGGSGMGRAAAERFAAAKASVMVCDVAEDNGNQTVDLIKAKGGDAAFIAADVAVSRRVANLVAQTVDRFGRLDFACNTAAVNLEMNEQASDEDFDRVIAVNLRGTYLCIKHQVRQMQKQSSGGAIVNFSSVTALRSTGPYMNAYVASKSGVIALSRVAAMRHTGEGIRINTIIPGAIDTPMLQSSLKQRGISVEDMARGYSLTGRAGRPEDIAEAVMWLCSDYSSYVVGVNLPVDGGALIG